MRRGHSRRARVVPRARHHQYAGSAGQDTHRRAICRVSFHGTLTAVDTNAMTLTVEKLTFDMTSETIVTKDEKPAVLAEGVVGDRCAALTRKTRTANWTRSRCASTHRHRRQQKNKIVNQLTARKFPVMDGRRRRRPFFYCRFHQLVSPFDFSWVFGNSFCCRSNRLRAASRAMMNSS